MSFKIFQSQIKPWAEMCKEAATFADSIGIARVISVSHSWEHGNLGIIIVWYRP
jgi:hypothetical protein